MHFFMSYVGSIGVLMAGTGMKERLEEAFDIIPKMLTGKKYPQNLRTLRMLIEEVLRLLLTDEKITSHSQHINVSEEKSKSSRSSFIIYLFLFEVEKKQRYALTHGPSTHVFKQLN